MIFTYMSMCQSVQLKACDCGQTYLASAKMQHASFWRQGSASLVATVFAMALWLGELLIQQLRWPFPLESPKWMHFSNHPGFKISLPRGMKHGPSWAPCLTKKTKMMKPRTSPEKEKSDQTGPKLRSCGSAIEWHQHPMFDARPETNLERCCDPIGQRAAGTIFCSAPEQPGVFGIQEAIQDGSQTIIDHWAAVFACWENRVWSQPFLALHFHVCWKPHMAFHVGLIWYLA